MEEVTIKMSWWDAVRVKAILSTRLIQLTRMKNDYVTRGEDVPNWLEYERMELLRINQILRVAVVTQ